MNVHPLLLHARISAPTRMGPTIAYAGTGSEWMGGPRALLQVDGCGIHTNLTFSLSSKIKPIIIKRRKTTVMKVLIGFDSKNV